jgi:conjugal transfer pilus assembly protein TraK
MKYLTKHSLFFILAHFLLMSPVFAKDVIPGQTTMVDVSNADINRIVCPEPVQEAVYSEEKGLSVRYVGRDVFVKFLVSDHVRPSPAELFLVCDGEVYSLVLNPAEIALQTIHLSSGIKKRITANRSLFEGLAYEEKISKAIQAVLTDRLPDGFRVSKAIGGLTLFHQIKLDLNRIIYIEGEGIRIKEYRAELVGESPVTLQEKDFLKKEIALEPIAVSIEVPHLTSINRVTHILIVERTKND